jgi:outer membrane protein assembly factor BamB
MTRTCRDRLLLSLAVSAASLVLALPVPAAAPPTWTYKAESRIRWYRTTPSGVLLVCTEHEVQGIAPDSGAVIWRIALKNPKTVAVDVLAHPSAAVLTLGDQGPGLPPLAVIDLRDGRPLWTSATLGILRSTGCYLIPGTDEVLLRGSPSPGGGNDTAVLFDLATGAPLWTNATLARPRFPYMYGTNLVRPQYATFLDTDTTMIVAAWDRLFLKVNLVTGETAWEAIGNPAKEPPPSDDGALGDLIGDIGSLFGKHKSRPKEKTPPKQPEVHEMDFRYPPILVVPDEDRFYAAYQGTVAAFSMTSGECLWSDPPRLMGLAAQMADLPIGLLVRVLEPRGKDAAHRIVLLDKGTGAIRWTWPKLYWSASSDFLVEDERVLIAADGRIRAVALATRTETTFAKLDFEDIDEAYSLLAVPSGYAALGRSNLGIYAKADGHRIKKYYRPPPNDEGWGAALLGLSALTLAADPAHLGSRVAIGGYLDPMVGVNKILKDYSASKEKEDSAYFLADTAFGDETGTGIVRVRKETGEVTGQILLGTKEPDYALDLEGRLYFHPDSNSIRCYRF